MARTTIDLDSVVLGELKRRGEREGKSMGRVASELLAAALSSPLDLPAAPFSWHASDLGVPLVDLEDAEAVRRALTQLA